MRYFTLSFLLLFLLSACNETATAPTEELPENTPDVSENTETNNEEETTPDENTESDNQEDNSEESIEEEESSEEETNTEEEEENEEEEADTTTVANTIDTLLIQTFGVGDQSSSPYLTGLCYEDGSGTCPGDANHSESVRPRINWQQYAIVDPTTRPETYFNTLTDHTGLPNGRILAIDMGNYEGVFYSQTVSGAEANARYNVNMWAGHFAFGDVNKSPIMEIVVMQDGQELMRVNTGNVPMDDNWYSYGGEFTAISTGDITFMIENKKSERSANDPAIDDITIIKIP